MGRSRGRPGGPLPSLRNYKNIGFLSNTGPDPLKIAKLPSQHSILGHYWHTSLMRFKCWVNYGPLVMVFVWSSLPSKIKTKKLSKLDPSDKLFWICACLQIQFTNLTRLEIDSLELSIYDEDKTCLNVYGKY